MKPFLYAGAALMIGASIYGFVDYGKTKNDSQFKKMYGSEISRTESGFEAGVTEIFKKELVKTETPKAEPAEEVAEVKATKNKKSMKKKKKKLNYKQFSRAPLREDEIIELDATEQ